MASAPTTSSSSTSSSSSTTLEDVEELWQRQVTPDLVRVHRRFEACRVDFSEDLLQRFEKHGVKGLSVEELAYDVAKDGVKGHASCLPGPASSSSHEPAKLEEAVKTTEVGRKRVVCVYCPRKGKRYHLRACGRVLGKHYIRRLHA